MFGSEVRQPAWGPVNGIPRAPVWLSTGLPEILHAAMVYLAQKEIRNVTYITWKPMQHWKDTN